MTIQFIGVVAIGIAMLIAFMQKSDQQKKFGKFLCSVGSPR